MWSQTRDNDNISMIFADGTFGNAISGNFQAFYRTSANRTMRIKPDEIIDVQILQLTILASSGKTETLTVGLELKSPVTNATISETSTSIRANAPNIHTQNRMIQEKIIMYIAFNPRNCKSKITNRVRLVA